jgi:hypothetical protein
MHPSNSMHVVPTIQGGFPYDLYKGELLNDKSRIGAALMMNSMLMPNEIELLQAKGSTMSAFAGKAAGHALSALMSGDAAWNAMAHPFRVVAFVGFVFGRQWEIDALKDKVTQVRPAIQALRLATDGWDLQRGGNAVKLLQAVAQLPVAKSGAISWTASTREAVATALKETFKGQNAQKALMEFFVKSSALMVANWRSEDGSNMAALKRKQPNKGNVKKKARVEATPEEVSVYELLRCIQELILTTETEDDGAKPIDLPGHLRLKSYVLLRDAITDVAKSYDMLSGVFKNKKSSGKISSVGYYERGRE